MFKSRTRLAVVFLLCFLIAFFVFGQTVKAKQYEISDYDVEMVLQENGDFLIKEKITFNFIEGTFSWVEREVPGRGFAGLEFISLDSLDGAVYDYEVDEGNKLRIKWYFPETTGKTTFLIKYRALKGLVSKNGKNVIDWNAVGSGWQVPIRNVDVTIHLPQEVQNLRFDPSSEAFIEGNREITFHCDYLSSGTRYHVVVSFTEIIAMPEVKTPSFSFPVLSGLFLGLLIAILDILLAAKKRPVPESSGIKPDELTPSEWGGIYHAISSDRRGIAAEVFSLARAGKIKLVSKLKPGILGSKKAEVKVEVVSEENLNSVQRIIVNALKKHGNLKKFSRDHRVFTKAQDAVKKMLLEKNILSRARINLRNRIFLSGVLILVLGIAELITLLINLEGPNLLMIPVLSLLIWGPGRLIKGALTTPLSSSGLYLLELIESDLDKKKKDLDVLIQRKDASSALKVFFDNLPWIILHKRFNSSSLNKYKKVFREVKEIKLPDWLEIDAADLGRTLDAMDLVEFVDYTMATIVIIASSTGAAATAGGAGAGGSGAGGGGGSAG